MRAEQLDEVCFGWQNGRASVPARPEVLRHGENAAEVSQRAKLDAAVPEHMASTKRTGVPVIINTSFNLRGEAIVHTLADAVRAFFSSGMDALVIGNFLVEK
jgi:hypothetical protein